MSKLGFSEKGAALKALLAKRMVFLDGGMGTLIQRLGLTENDFRKGDARLEGHSGALKGNNDLLSITRPDVISKIHSDYYFAGSDIATTNTFASNIVAQSDYNLGEDLIRDMNLASARVLCRTRDAASAKLGKELFAAGSIGPMNKSASIAADVSDPSARAADFDELQSAYRAQIDALWDGGVDLFIIETSFDTLNVKAALYAYLNASQERGYRLPIAVSMTVSDMSGRILSGQTIEAFYASIRHADPIFVGLNCALGAEKMRPYIEAFARVAECGVHCYPNAGLPNPLSEFGYDQRPEDTAKYLGEYCDLGLLNVVGGCCGTTPAHIKAVVERCSRCAPRVPKTSDSLTLSGLDILRLPDSGAPFVFVGERTNVMGSGIFRKMIKEGRFADAVGVARNQVSNGANVIDVNFDEGMLDSPACMKKFLNLLGAEPEIARVPVMIDSSDWETILAGLKCVQGKCIVNSISLKEGEEKFLSHAREVKRFGAAAVVMAFDERGQAATLSDRISVCRRAYKLLVDDADFDPRDIVFDPNVLTVATGMKEHDSYALDFIEAVREIKRTCPFARTSAGVSNISFALRGNNRVREAMHSVFLYRAREAGLDMGIVNAGMLASYDEIDRPLRDAVEAVILNSSPDATEKLLETAQNYRDVACAEKKRVDESANLTPQERLDRAFVKGDEDAAARLATEFFAELKNPVKVIEGPLMSSMKAVGELFGAGKMFLPQVVKSARVMKRAVAELSSYMEKKSGRSGAKFVIATVRGDVHDIGKNIVAAVLSCNGFDVEDLGVMVEPDKIVEAAKHADVLGLSGLITPSLEEMATVLRALERAGLRVPVTIGGATTGDLHTAVKLAPLYSGVVVRVGDAGLSAGVCARLADPNELPKFALETAARQQALRDGFTRESARLADPKKLLPIAVARSKKAVCRLSKGVSEPPFFGVKTFDTTVADLEKIFPWPMYFRTWGVDAKEFADGKLGKFCSDTLSIFARLKKTVSPKIRVGFFGANSRGDDIVLFDGEREVETLRLVRSQTENSKGECLCLADFVADESSGARDAVALYVATAGVEAEAFADTFAKSGDRYSYMIAQTLCDCLAESLSVYAQKRIFSEDSPSERAGVRAAVGYPSYPDHAEKLKFWKLLGVRENLGVNLTETFMMTPKSSVAALWICNPSARYFSPEIGVDQLGDYAARIGKTPADAARTMSVEALK